jgi:hypothetical protein
MNVLSLMEFVPAGADCAAQVKTMVEQGQCQPLSPFVGFFFTYKDLNLTSQQAADGSGTPGRDDLCLLNGLPVEADCQVLFSIVFYSRHEVELL